MQGNERILAVPAYTASLGPMRMRPNLPASISPSPFALAPIVRHLNGALVSIDLPLLEALPDDLLSAARAALEFCASLSAAAAPGSLAGTPFQRAVWEALLSIPPGETRSYAQVALEIGAPRAARAVANACGANPLAILVPCHRVVPARGGVGGYRWGTEWKSALLAAERVRTPLPGKLPWGTSTA